jgi:flagellar FliJ protein
MRNYRYHFETKSPEGRRASRNNPARTIDAQQREVLLIRSMIAEIEHLLLALDRSIEVEKELTGVRDRSHFAYSMSARAMETRRNNLKVTRDALIERLSSFVDQAAA